jgi:PAS domain S-box-containing protein
MLPSLNILIAEDNPMDAQLVLRQLRKDCQLGEVTHVWTEEAFVEAIAKLPDLILSDYDMGSFTGFRALEILREQGRDTPFILISGTIGEDLAVEAIKQGASDYLLKDRLGRLGTAVSQAIKDCRLRRERKQAETALAMSESRYRLLVEQASDGIFTVSSTGRYTDVNARGLEMLHYTREDFLRLNLGDLIAREDGVRLAQEIAALKQGQTRVSEFKIRRSDGTWFDAEISARALPDGQLLGIVRDLTERRRSEQVLRESEERFRQLAENIHEVFWITDPEKRTMLYISPAYETIWGRSRLAIMENPSDWLEAIHPDDRPRVSASIARQLQGDYDEVYRVVRPDGCIRWVRDKAFPIRDHSGNVYRIVGTAEDITENRKLEAQFLQAQKMEAIGTLAGGIAHDFNNILTAISGYTELIKAQVPAESHIAAYLQALQQASTRATSLVRQILAFSRRGNQERRPIQLRSVVEESLKLLRATIPVTVSFDVQLDDKLPPVLADATQIHQVMMNLGTNAAHAMNDQVGRFTVRLEFREITERFARTTTRLRTGPHVCLIVSDSGHGMSPEIMARMYEPFFTTKGPGEGTGLGLAVLHGVMQSHNGDVVVKSTVGAGTVFELYFPAHLLPQEPLAPKDDVGIPHGLGERILLVDDEGPVMIVGRLMLEQIGYKAQGHTDPSAMLEHIRADPGAFDLVITDLTMPAMTGLDFARQLQTIRPDLPIILTTGYNSTLTPERVRELGIREMLLKPLSMHSLAQALRRALNQPTARLTAAPTT